MERGSVVDAQITLHEEINKEILKCKDWRYYYTTYCKIVIEDGKLIKPTLTNADNNFIAILELQQEGHFKRIR